MYSIGEAAALFGVSVRTLRYYDRIGLLSPTKIGENGYRYYNAQAIDLLREIMFYRELDMPLSDIAVLMSNPGRDRLLALERHREVLLFRQKQLNGLLGLIDKTLEQEGIKLSKNKKPTTAADLEQMKKEYSAEVRERWGDTPEYAESQRRQAEKTPETELDEAKQADEIFAKFAAIRDTSPDSPQAAALVNLWQDFITQHYYPCSREILAGLAEMYVGDDRFRENLDRFGEGTAQFMSDAIKCCCK